MVVAIRADGLGQLLDKVTVPFIHSIAALLYRSRFNAWSMRDEVCARLIPAFHGQVLSKAQHDYRGFDLPKWHRGDQRCKFIFKGAFEFEPHAGRTGCCQCNSRLPTVKRHLHDLPGWFAAAKAFNSAVAAGNPLLYSAVAAVLSNHPGQMLHWNVILTRIFAGMTISDASAKVFNMLPQHRNRFCHSLR